MRPSMRSFIWLKSDSSSAASRAKSTDTDVRLDRLMLTTQAMWTLLRDKLGVTEEELLNRINDIDLSDGKLGGKARKTAVSCPACGRTISPKFAKCMYCGQPIMHDPFA